MAKKKTKYVMLSRGNYGDYAVWRDTQTLQLVQGGFGQWLDDSPGEEEPVCEPCADQWHACMGLRLKKNAKRRVKITFYKGGGCSWRWAGKESK